MCEQLLERVAKWALGPGKAAMEDLMRKIMSIVAGAALAVPSLAGAADVSRPTAVSYAAPTKIVSGTRVGHRVDDKSQLLGAPLFLFFLGAVAVTIGTIVIVNNNGGSSPGS